MGVVTGDLLTVRTAHGEAILAARVDATVQPGTVWIPESLPNAAGAGLAGETPTESVTIKKA
jgi:formylmethanofuran dehydrogenase subunit D